MIPVTLQPEPADFDVEVRQKGLAWLSQQGISRNAPPPKASDLPSYWSHSNYDLWRAYSGTCAYLAIYFEWPLGASSTDHFIAKSKHAGDAYEWDNYRLSCLGANRSKNKFSDILDPVGLATDLFVLNLATGKIKANKLLSAQDRADVRKTIKRLKLDSVQMNEMRARHFCDYLRHQCSDILKFYSPFVWYEAQRQGLL